MLIFPEYSQKWQHIKKQFKLKRVKRLVIRERQINMGKRS